MKKSEAPTTPALVGMITTENNTELTTNAQNVTSSTTIRKNTTVPADNNTSTIQGKTVEVSVNDGKKRAGSMIHDTCSNFGNKEVSSKMNESVMVVETTNISSILSIKEGNDNGNDRVTIDKMPNKPLVSQSRNNSININNQQISSKTDKISVPVCSLDPTITTDKNETLTTEILRPDSHQTVGIINPHEEKTPVHVAVPALNQVVTESIPSVVNPSTTEINISKNVVTNVPNTGSTAGDFINGSTLSLADAKFQRQREPLTKKYNPYISYTDTCLGDARSRLQIALDQTRQLRAAFTERVYGKYRICLQPPPQTSDIIKAIRDDPSGIYQKLQQEIKLIKEEKKAEKKESQKLGSYDVAVSAAMALPSSPFVDASISKDTSVGSSSASASDATATVEDTSNIVTALNLENAEQFMYVTSGLSMIVLPDDDVPSIYMSMYQDRGPIQDKTGQRVQGLSAAAVTAGKAILERSRQCKVARVEREKRSQQQNEQAHNFFDRNYYSTLPSQLIERNGNGTTVELPPPPPPPSGTIADTITIKPTPVNAAVSIKENPLLVSSSSQKTKIKGTASHSLGSSKKAEGKKAGAVKRARKNSPKSLSGRTPASAKAIRAKVQASMSLSTLLNLNPIHGELRTDNKYSAATLAMMERGVGSYQGPTAQYHKNTPHRFKHPFPDSLGGRRRPVSNGPKQNVAKETAASQGDHLRAELQLTLSPIPSVKDRRNLEKIEVLPKEKAATSRAKLSIRKILDQFTSFSALKCADFRSIEPSHSAVESNAITPGNIDPIFGRPKNQRRVSEIGFVRGLYLDSQDEGKARPEVDMTGTIQDSKSSKCNTGIDSSLTLNVLKAVGLIKSSVSGDKNAERSCFQTSLASSLFNENSTTGTESYYSDPVSKLKDLEHRLSAQKRSFTEAFYSEAEILCTRSVAAARSNEEIKDLNLINSTTGSQINQVTKVQPVISAPPPLSLRGGGSNELLLDSGNDGKKSIQSQEQKNEGVDGFGLGTAIQNSQGGNTAKRNGNRQQTQNQTMNAAAAVTQANMMHQNMLWDERSQQQRLASLQSPLLSNSGGITQQHAAGQLHVQLQSADHYRQANALQLAHQLRLSRLSAHGHATAGDMADYIGGLRRSQAQAQAQAQAAYDWSSVGAVSAAATVASSQSLAVLGLNSNRAGIMPLSVEDRTRVLMAREQQNLAARVAAAQRQQAVALMRGMATVDNTPYTQSSYPHISGQLLNTPASGLIERQRIQSRSINNNAQSLKRATAEHCAASQKVKHESKQQQSKLQKELLVVRSSPKDHPVEHKIEKKELTDGDKPKVRVTKTIDKKKDISTSYIRVSNKRKDSPNTHNEIIQSEKKSRTFIAESEGPSTVAAISVYNLPKPLISTDKFKKLIKVDNIPPVTKEEARIHSEINQGNSTKKFTTKQIHDPPTSKSKESVSSKAISMNIEGNIQNNATVKAAATWLQYYVPPAPIGITSDFTATVLAGKCHEAIGVSMYRDLAVEGLRVVNYITLVGMAVPIPKTVVMNPLKERMNALVFKNSNVGSMPASSRDIIAAAILLWLWRNQEGCFQRAFAISGRIDVDSECKWFVNTAINKAVTALSNEVTGSTSRATGLTTALLAHKNKSLVGPKGAHGIADQDSLRTTATKIDLLAASVVSKSLNTTLVLNEEMNSAIPKFSNLIDYLDECRKSALFAKSQERALLAAVVSRKATVSFSFSHAYVSAMVRAGEALGHGPLFEVVQNESCGVSTMIPYDVFTDELGAWEDPCRPRIGFTEGLTGDELMRKSHARAMIQKSLKKLQDRQNVKGGTQIPGPYIDPGSSSAGSTGSKGSSGQRGGSHRRRSSEPSIQPGSGSAIATSWDMYDPNHQSPPLEWDLNAAYNSPYGRHNERTRPRSLSLAQGAAVLRHSGKVLRRQRSISNSPAVNAVQKEQAVLDKSPNEGEEKHKDYESRISTREIPWGDIAGIFQKVQLPDAIKEQKEKEAKLSAKERTIFAPIVRELDSIPVVDKDTEEKLEADDEEEDLADDTILVRHRGVLDRMKAKLAFVLKDKNRNQDRRKSRDKLGT